MSWFSSLWKPPKVHTVDTSQFYDRAQQYTDPHSRMNQAHFGQLQRQGQSQLGLHGLLGERMANMGYNPFASEQYQGQGRQLTDQMIGRYGDYMAGQGQLGLGYTQLGQQGEMQNAQMQTAANMQQNQFMQGLFGQVLGGVAGLSPGVGGWLANLLGPKGDTGTGGGFDFGAGGFQGLQDQGINTHPGLQWDFSNWRP